MYSRPSCVTPESTFFCCPPKMCKIQRLTDGTNSRLSRSERITREPRSRALLWQDGRDFKKSFTFARFCPQSLLCAHCDSPPRNTSEFACPITVFAKKTETTTHKEINGGALKKGIRVQHRTKT